MKTTVFAFLLISTVSAADKVWTCIDLQSTPLTEDTKVNWITQNCTNDPAATPLLTVNAVVVDLTSKLVRVVPAAADSESKLQTTPQMASMNPKLIAGINGGYFWRVDVSGVWVDDVCWGKTRSDANSPVSIGNANAGIGDGLVKVDGKVISNNCNCPGYSRPAVLILDDANSHIEVLHRGETVAPEVQNAIAAGPNLVSFNISDGTSFIDIPADDDNINILEHAANTAVGVQLVQEKGVTKATKIFLVTTDGSDECGPKDITCGLNSKDLASLMKEHFSASMAMSMDQGGSTTMWVKGVNPSRDGVVSRSHNTRPVEEDGARNVANALFIELL